MMAQRKTPGGNRGRESTQASGYSNQHSSPYATAAATALARELSILMIAADKLAAGHGLRPGDHERLHEAHQHIITALADLMGREVMQ